MLSTMCRTEAYQDRQAQVEIWMSNMIRRVKCDETKPCCLRCSKSGWNCEGYPPALNRHASSQIILPKSSLPLLPKGTFEKRIHSNKSFLIEPSFHPRFHNEDERRYFNVFITQTAPELTGFFESNIWNRLILQACHEELYAWHAVVAIGALHRTLEVSNSSKHDDGSKAHHTFALKQYGIAIRHMQQVAQREMNEYRLRDTLISCLLTTCFESYIGNQEDALNQAQAGIDVLLNWQFDCPLQDDDMASVRKVTARSKFLDDDLLGAFTRLDFQVMQFKYTVKDRVLSPSYPTIPPSFESVTEARFYWDLIVRRAQQWHIAQHSAATEQFSTLDFGENNTSENFKRGSEFADRTERELVAYEEVTALWYEKFKPMFEKSREQPGSKMFVAASMMMVRYLPSKFAISRKAPDCDLYADQYFEDYKSVVSLTRGVLEEYSMTLPGKAGFGMDVNFVLSLFLVATRCREPSVRREAISLLVKHPRREGLWDSLMAARVATWLMEKEEEGMADGKYVPETARLRIVKNDFVLKERKAVIRCSKMVEGCEQRVELPDVTLTW
ncbi:hypothetical protein EG329_010991 [Mollisiaceae sp. DMI_Dod_QoI]|nr:hypothetical protein EG329_010991 [Helotiales sp. DMI_Dod_QoI]